jgi:hypothetical protein
MFHFERKIRYPYIHINHSCILSDEARLKLLNPVNGHQVLLTSISLITMLVTNINNECIKFFLDTFIRYYPCVKLLKTIG